MALSVVDLYRDVLPRNNCGRCKPAGKWKGLVEFPNTMSKIQSMIEHVGKPLIERFRGRCDELSRAAGRLSGYSVGHKETPIQKFDFNMGIMVTY